MTAQPEEQLFTAQTSATATAFQQEGDEPEEVCEAVDAPYDPAAATADSPDEDL